MSTVARTRILLGATFAVLIVALVLYFVADGTIAVTTNAGDGTGGAGVAAPSGSFSIAGNATEPISPGVRAALDLKLTNPHDLPMSVTDLRVTVLKVSAPNADAAHPCAVGDFAVDQVSSSHKIRVTARATGSLSSMGIPRATLPHVGLLNRPVNQDGCKGASLTLAFTASGALGN